MVLRPPWPPKITVRIDKQGEMVLRFTNSPSYSHPVCMEGTAKRAKCHFALRTARPTATLPVWRALQRGRSATSPYKQPVLQPPVRGALQGGRSATSPYEHSVLPRLRAAQRGQSAIFCQSNNPRRRFKRQVVKIAQRNMRVKCLGGVADFGGVLPMSVAGVEPVRI